MVDEQINVATKRRLDEQTLDPSNEDGSPGIGARPSRRMKRITEGPEDVPDTKASRGPGEEKPISAGVSPRPARSAEHRLHASGTVDAASSPSAAPRGRRESCSDGHGVDDGDPEDDTCTVGRSKSAELYQPSSSERSLPRRDDEPRAAAHSAPGPLSPEDISKFEEDGFVMLKRAFSSEVAAACRESLWKRLKGEGITRGDPSTWVRKVGLAEIYGISSSPKKRRGSPWKDALSPRLMSAVQQLLGPDAWEEFGCGWWMVTFPGFAGAPWGAEGRWHCDGAHFRHYPHSREIGLLPIFLFSDVRPHGGGTAVIRGSHKVVAELVWNKAGTTGLTGPELSGAAREALLPAASEDVIETIGSAGDILLTHPLLLHARSTNLAPVDEAGVRFMCHPAVPLKRHLDLHAPPEAFSVVERIMWRACPSHWRDAGGGRAVPKPDQCDHSPVELPSKKARWKKKGKPSHGCRAVRVTHAPQKPDISEHGVSSPARQASGKFVECAPKDTEAGEARAKGGSGEGSCSQDGSGSHCHAVIGGAGEEGVRESGVNEIGR